MMMGTWVVWAMGIAGLLGVSALLAESAFRERGWPTRLPWAVALASSVAVAFGGLWRPSPGITTASSADGWLILDPSWLGELGSMAVASTPTLGERVESYLVVAWVAASAVALALLVGGLATLRARAARWHRARVQGESVLLSADFGPALVGVVHPEIVLPRWALAMSEPDQRMACLHEAEHRAARDTWLLLGGALCVAAMPWNLPLLWQLRRLRGAVEVDCDARVLARGASKRAYGSLLLALGSARGRSPLPVLALARSESLLERRLKMIVRNVGERRPVRSLVAMCLSGALFVLACDAPAPTTVDGEPSASFEAVEAQEKAAPAGTVTPRSAGAFDFSGPVGEDLKAKLYTGELRLLVDGQEQDAMPEGLDAASIERVEIRKNPENGEASTIQIFTRDPDAQPLVLVDGVRLEGDLSALSPEDIERVEVLKGDAALDAYGEEGAAGVIRVTLKEMASDRR